MFFLLKTFYFVIQFHILSDLFIYYSNIIDFVDTANDIIGRSKNIFDLLTCQSFTNIFGFQCKLLSCCKINLKKIFISLSLNMKKVLKDNHCDYECQPKCVGFISRVSVFLNIKFEITLFSERTFGNDFLP